MAKQKMDPKKKKQSLVLKKKHLKKWNKKTNKKLQPWSATLMTHYATVYVKLITWLQFGVVN